MSDPTPETLAREMAEKCAKRLTHMSSVSQFPGESTEELIKREEKETASILLCELNLVELLKDKQRLEWCIKNNCINDRLAIDAAMKEDK